MKNFNINLEKLEGSIKKGTKYILTKTGKHVKTSGFLIALALITTCTNFNNVVTAKTSNNSVVNVTDDKTEKMFNVALEKETNKKETVTKSSVVSTSKSTEEKVTEHIVEKGETLSLIAKKYGTTYQELAKINGIKNPNVITVGQVIKLTPNAAEKTKVSEKSKTTETNQSTKKEVKRLALTFDDGPGAYTNELLDILAEYNVKATFFIQGCNVKAYSDVIKRMYEEGHQIANHTYSHENLNKITVKQAKNTIEKTTKVLEDLGVEPSNYFRPPYGNITSTQKKNIDDYILIYWGTDTRDWSHRDSDKLKNILINDVVDGDIVLMHDIHKSTVAGVKKALPEMIKKGYEFYTLEELFEVNEVELKPGVLYKTAKKTK